MPLPITGSLITDSLVTISLPVMTTTTFIFKNALRNKRRATLSILSVAASLFLLVTLQVALREMTVPPQDVSGALRVIVRSKISIANLLPARQRQIIERIPGVEAVSPFTWFGGTFKGDEEMAFAQFAVDPKQLPALSPDFHVTPAEHAAWVADRRQRLVGQDASGVGIALTLRGRIGLGIGRPGIGTCRSRW